MVQPIQGRILKIIDRTKTRENTKFYDDTNYKYFLRFVNAVNFFWLSPSKAKLLLTVIIIQIFIAETELSCVF